MSDSLFAIRNALSLVGVEQNKEVKSANLLPTAKARAAIDLLANSSPEKMIEHQVNLRDVAAGLFNWSGQTRTTKNVIRALNTALTTEGKYHHAVELAAYIAALAPLLEPDRLARLFTAMNEVETAYAPARYTLQLSHKLGKILSSFNDERREKLAYSLWVESHKGRWWDLTTGIVNPQLEDADNFVFAENELLPEKDLIEAFSKFSLTFNPANVHQISRLKENNDIREALTNYNNALLKGKVVDPDIALLASHIKWLEIDERPESPVGSLIDNLITLKNEIEFDFPEKPKSFSALFPNITFYGGANFPFPNSILSTDGKDLANVAKLEVVKTATDLAANRTYMGNCTWSYKNRMEDGKYVLYRVHRNGEIYNGSLTLVNNRWRLGEINSRFNRGAVPADIRAAFSKFIDGLPAMQADNEMTKSIENYNRLKAYKQKKYRYSI
jgi:hypothetical protein